MNHFKKKGFWVFYFAMVLAGAFIIVALGLQNQSPVIPDVNAQMNMGYFSSYSLSDLGSFSGAMTAYSHPVDFGETIMTCIGCSQTMSTCAWQCSATYSNCPSGDSGGQGSIFGLFGGSYTFGTCPTSTTCNWKCLGGGINTLMTCSSGLLGSCGRGGNSTYTTCGGSLCNIVSYTSNTCNVNCGYVIPTTKTCYCKEKLITNNCPIIDGSTRGFCPDGQTRVFCPDGQTSGWCESVTMACRAFFQTFEASRTPAY